MKPIFLPLLLTCFFVNSFFSSNVIANSLPKEPITPIPDIIITNPDMVALGKRLFFDTRLSADNTVSCHTCHLLDKGGVDGLDVSIGINGLKGTRNAPTIYNSSLNFRQFWDGRVRTLEQQVSGPVHNPLEMGANWPDITKKLSQDKTYIDLFNKVFSSNSFNPKSVEGQQHGGISSRKVIKAIATFERSLLTPDSPFDLYLKGDKNAIDEETKEGYQLFKKYGCIACHNGVAIGANMYSRLGIIFPYYVASNQSASFDEDENNDLGRFSITQEEKDKFIFKVPSLRNVAITGPYFHNGSIKSLYRAVSIMIKYQLGKIVKKNDVEKIVLFLESLTAPVVKKSVEKGLKENNSLNALSIEDHKL
jgi:cytochrome c peroxidase